MLSEVLVFQFNQIVFLATGQIWYFWVVSVLLKGHPVNRGMGIIECTTQYVRKSVSDSFPKIGVQSQVLCS